MSAKAHISGEQLCFWCPGCSEAHRVTVTGSSSRWGWNQSLDRPTLNPSIKVTSGHYAPEWKQGRGCWCIYNREHPDDPSGFECGCCHSFVKDGRIQFLPDCTHALAGKTVDLPDWEAQ